MRLEDPRSLELSSSLYPLVRKTNSARDSIEENQEKCEQTKGITANKRKYSLYIGVPIQDSDFSGVGMDFCSGGG